MARVRAPAVAGSFYPAHPSLLCEQVDRLLAEARQQDGPPPAALVVPHAGYVYSGPVAASGYARLRHSADRVRAVVLLGPAHFVPVRGLAHPEAERLQTPLGDVEVARSLLAQVEALPQVCGSAAAHAPEHSLEVQLPFLQRALPHVPVLPLLVGHAAPEAVAEVLEVLWTDGVLPIVSTDLSHYLPDAEARALDRSTAARILALEGPLESERACGAAPLNGLLLAARRRGLRVEQLDLRTSADTAGEPEAVVGYGAFALFPRQRSPEEMS
jgi:MEMO1 family protein